MKLANPGTIPDRSGQAEEISLQVNRILVPVDFSEASHKALWSACAFAKQFRSEILILHVTEVPVGLAEAGVSLSHELIEQMQQATQERLARLLGEAKRYKISARTLVRTGIAYHEIVEAAKEENVDLVILSTHGRTGLKRLFLGSTAERVVRHAPCPVFVVREKGEHFATRREVERSTRKRQGRTTNTKRRVPPLFPIPP